MVWTTEADLLNARDTEPQLAVNSLFTKAMNAGISTDDSAGLLENTAFLAELVKSGQITQATADDIQATAAAGANLLTTVAGFAHNLATVLLFSSLPETYAYRDIALQLAKTGQLTDKTKAGERLGKTDAIIQAITTGLASGDGQGLHRAFLLGVRHQRLSRIMPERWINQVSLAYTLLTFSFTPFEAMQRGGLVPLPAPDRQLAWLKMWNVVGSLMGIGPAGLPGTVDEATALTALIRSWSAQYLRTPQGERLITVLVELQGADTAPFFLFGGDALMGLLGVHRPPTP